MRLLHNHKSVQNDQSSGTLTNIPAINIDQLVKSRHSLLRWVFPVGHSRDFRSRQVFWWVLSIFDRHYRDWRLFQRRCPQRWWVSRSDPPRPWAFCRFRSWLPFGRAVWDHELLSSDRRLQRQRVWFGLMMVLKGRNNVISLFFMI